MWVRPIFKEKQRLLHGASDNLVTEMELDEHEMFYNYCRMSTGMFHKLLSIVGPSVIEKHYVVRDPIPARTRLLLCLRYLASRDSMVWIAYAFRIGTSTVSIIIAETCEQLWNRLHESVIPTINEDNWLRIANDFETKWDFPHCIDAIDGKHVVIQMSRYLNNSLINIKMHKRCIHTGKRGSKTDARRKRQVIRTDKKYLQDPRGSGDGQ